MKFRPLCFDYHTDATNLLRDARKQTAKIWIRSSLDDADDDVETETDLDDEDRQEETTAMKAIETIVRDKKLPTSTTLEADDGFGSGSDSSVRANKLDHVEGENEYRPFSNISTLA
jgi:hypothetical protein